MKGPAAIEDTLIAHHAFASHLPKSLAHVTSVYCDARPWKILAGKDAGKEKGLAPWERLERGDEDAVKNLLDYNAADCRLTALDWQRMQPDLEDERHTYESDKQIAQLCRRMTETGIGFDIAGREELSRHLRARKRGLLAAMRDLTGKKSFHPARQNDVRQALFGRFKAPLLRPTPTGLASTNNETLEWLSGLGGRAGELADLTLRWRSADKTLGSYVDNVFFVEKPGENIGRVHPPWKLGPVTGRLSCWLMTLPRYNKNDWEAHVRALYVADPRSTRAHLVAQIHDAAIFEVEGRFVYYDLSQAELRCAAFFSGDEALIEACKQDVHTENAKVIFEGIADPSKRLARANELSPFLDNNGKAMKWKAVPSKQGGCKDERDIAKNCSFCVTYEGTAERALATLTAAGKKATMASCSELVNRFHMRYKAYYRYIDTNEAFVREHGYLRTVLARRIRWLGQFAPRTEIANTPIQSGIADLHNKRLPVIEARCKGLKKAEDVEKVIAEVWEEPVVVPHNGLSFRMPIDLKRGTSWSHFG